MPRNKLLSDISLSSAQAILNQLSGIIVFFIISKYLDKSSLGHINWALAVLMVVFSVLGFGLEHVAVKKAATGIHIGLLLQSYMMHVVVTGIFFILVIWIIQSKVPALHQDGQLFLLLAISQCFSFFAIPFRQIANGLEKFRALFIMSSCANIIKVLLLLLFAFMQQIELSVIIKVYLLASFVELLVCIFIYRVNLALPFIPGFNWKRYKAFIKEALPQLGITIFNTAVARMDWILLGLLSTAVVVAEYSFTNKLFELASLPLLIVAPVIFPKIARMFDGKEKQLWKTDYLKMLVRIEIVVAVFVMLVVNICWKDIIDPLTNNKYGSSTRGIIFIMSFAMPLIYINNIFWSILFAQGKMRVLFFIFLFTFLLNMIADSILIPFYQSKGAAFGFVFALAVQTCFYFRAIKVEAVRKAVIHLLPVTVSALVAGFMSVYLFDFFIIQLIAASAGYFLLLWVLKQVRSGDMQLIKKIITAG